MPFEIIIAPHSGFCFGVKRAIEIADRTLKSGGRVYSLGPIIHNPQVIARLRAAGLETVASVDDIDDGKVIIRSHGVQPEVIEQLDARGVEIIDATCPLVSKAQESAALLHREGYLVFIIGEQNHPEVQGLLGHAPGAQVVDPAGEVPEVARATRLGVIAQTTQSPEDFRRVLGRIASGEWGEIRVFNTICNATVIRQEAAVELAKEVDIMFVLGGHNSANTNRSAEICRAVGVETHHLETAGELDESWLAGKRRVGVTAGASTPEWLIDEFISHLRELSKRS